MITPDERPVVVYEDEGLRVEVDGVVQAGGRRGFMASLFSFRSLLQTTEVYDCFELAKGEGLKAKDAIIAKWAEQEAERKQNKDESV